MIVVVGIVPVHRSGTGTHGVGDHCRGGVSPITDQDAAGFQRIMHLGFRHPITEHGRTKPCYSHVQRLLCGSVSTRQQGGARRPSASTKRTVYTIESRLLASFESAANAARIACSEISCRSKEAPSKV